jgi:O-antigen/teichoic acid export membrane protein
LLAEFFLMRKLRNFPGTGDYRVSVREIATFAWHMAGTNILRAIANFGVLRILVARTLGLEMAGMFAFLQQLLMIVGRYLPANLLTNIIRPMMISRYVVGETDIVSQGIALLWKSNLLIIVLSMVVIAVAGDPLIALFSSGRFANAGIVMLILLLGLGITSQGQLFNMAMQIFSYTHQLRYFSLLSVLTPLAVILGSYWELIGVASGIVLSAWLLNRVTLLWLNRQPGHDIQLDWWSIFRGICLAILLTMIGWGIESKLGPWWALTFVLLAYGPGMMLVKPLNQQDMALLNRALRQFARFLVPFVRKN